MRAEVADRLSTLGIMKNLSRLVDLSCMGDRGKGEGYQGEVAAHVC